jgi:hypothetical protein
MCAELEMVTNSLRKRAVVPQTKVGVKEEAARWTVRVDLLLSFTVQSPES